MLTWVSTSVMWVWVPTTSRNCTHNLEELVVNSTHPNGANSFSFLAFHCYYMLAFSFVVGQQLHVTRQPIAPIPYRAKSYLMGSSGSKAASFSVISMVARNVGVRFVVKPNAWEFWNE